MRAVRRLQLAELVHECRQKLERDLHEVSKRDVPMTNAEARLIFETADLRLADVERALRSERPLPLGPIGRCLRRVMQRLRGLLRPRIGRLQHYPPRPLGIPSTYRQAVPPAPAPTISLVTPSYQQGPFIERTIRSVLTQGYPNLEYVVQDGGSTDETASILQRYGDRLTHWASESDTGHANALNRGFSSTTGEIMGWLNSDDLLLPGALSFVADYLARHPDVDVVYGNRLMIDDCDAEIGAWILPPHDDLALTLADFVPQETLFWRRRIWDAAGGRVDESFSYALDWDLLLRFHEAGARMVRLRRFIGAFRVHDEQRTSAEHLRGLEEMARLRERVHGRPMSLEEVNARLQPYLRRHVRAHLRQRISDRLPQAREFLVREPSETSRTGELALKV
jgi:glycosyltransferase involved in cell wall biosynthesis